MKKWLMVGVAALTFSLAACSEADEKTEVPSEETQENEAENSQRDIHYAQYYNVLSEAVDKLGFAPETSVYDEETYETGVYYAELIDFDGDGFEELYVLMKNDGKPRSTYAHRNVANYVHEVWAGNKEGDTPVLSFSYEIDAMQCSACDLSVTIVEDEDRSFISQFRHKTSQGYVYNEETFYTKSESSSHFEEKTIIQASEGDSIDGVAVEKAQLESELAKFTGERKPIIISEGGFKKYGFVQMGEPVIEPLLNKLSGTEADGKKLEGKMTEEVKAFLTDIHTKNLDVLDNFTYDTLVFNTIINTDIPYDLNEENYTLVYNRADVEAAIEQQFGVKVDLSKGHYAHPSEQMKAMLTYADDKFYMSATDFYSAETKRNFDEVTEVKENVYYVKMIDHEFDSMGYGDFDIDFQNTPIESMPAAAEPYLTKNIKRYAVVKIVDGEPKLQYIGKKPLYKTKIEQY